MKAVIYIRVSTSEQVDNYSLASQEEECRKYCQREGIEIAEIFRDGGASAKTANRPQLNALIAYCSTYKKEISSVIVYKFDRFARQAGDHHSVKAQLAIFGIKVCSVSEPFDESPMGKFSENLAASIAQLDNDVRSERARNGMLKAAKEDGRWLYPAPFGYISTPGKRAPSLIPDPKHKNLIKYAFEQASLGVRTQASILTELTEMGLRTNNGKPMCKQSFCNLLKNPIYTGVIKINGYPEIFQGDFEPIVETEVYERANNIASTQREIEHVRISELFPLKGFITCEICKRKLTGSYSKGRSAKYGYYRCLNNGCKTKLKKERLEEMFIERMREISVNPIYWNFIEAVFKDVWKERTKAHMAKEKQRRKELDRLTTKRDKLVSKYVFEEALDPETYFSFKDKLDLEINELNKTQPDHKLSETYLKKVVSFGKDVLSDIPTYWNNLGIDMKISFQRLIFPYGLTTTKEELGTAQKSWLFIDFATQNVEESKLVRLSSSDWNHIEGWLEGIESLRDFEEKRLESERIKAFQRY